MKIQDYFSLKHFRNRTAITIDIELIDPGLFFLPLSIGAPPT